MRRVVDQRGMVDANRRREARGSSAPEGRADGGILLHARVRADDFPGQDLAVAHGRRWSALALVLA